MREVATLAQRRRRVIAIGAALTAATFLVIVTVMINTFWRIGLGPQDLYEDHVTVVAWSVSMVLGGFAIRRRFWSKGPLDVFVAVVLGSDIGSAIWLSIWYLPHDRSGWCHCARWASQSSDCPSPWRPYRSGRSVFCLRTSVLNLGAGLVERRLGSEIAPR